MPWILLGQHERLGAAALVVDMGQVETRVEPVVAAAGEEEPAAVRAPVVKTLCTRTVHLVHCSAFACLHVEQRKAGLRMPDGEVAVVSLGVHDLTAVVGRAWPADALARQTGGDQSDNLRAELACL